MNATLSTIAGRLADWPRPFLFVCFFLTGAFGLVYEIVWSRYLALIVGNTAHAHMTVLATFMGGLALGAFLFGRLADRLENGVRAYGWIEAAIGVYGAMFPTLFGVFESALAPLAQTAAPGTPLMAVFKILLSAACILPPTILMGGTLPILTRHITATRVALRHNVALLYALNAAGAVAGGLVAGFFLIATFGMPGSMILAGCANALLGLLVVGVAPRFARRETDAATDTPAAGREEDRLDYGSRERAAALLVAFFSGFSGMALEVAWIRYFTLVLGSSTYAFTIMLAAFISGIAIGSYLLSRPRRGQTPLLPLVAGALAATAAFLALSLELYEFLPFVIYKIRSMLRLTMDTYPIYQVLSYLLCFAAMLLPTLVAGLAFPAAVRLAALGDRMGGRVGQVYALNTLGTLLGAVLTTVVLLSAIGLENIFRLLIVLNAAAAALLFAVFFGRRGRIAAAAIAAAIAIQFLAHRPIDPAYLNQGLYRLSFDDEFTYAQFRDWAKGMPTRFVAEGAHATVTVREAGRSPIIDAPTLMLAVNGKVDASTSEDMYTQIMIGHLPVMMHPDPKDVFLVGLGSGVTAGAILTHGVNVDLAEIAHEVIQAQELFKPYNHAPLENPRLRLFVEDAKTALRFADRSYDVVISEPTNPWIAGVAGLFTVEFFDTVKSRLRPGGVFAQWMHAYETTDDAVRLVISSLMARFAYVAIFEMLPFDYAFVASDAPLVASPENFEARLARPEVREDLARIHADSGVVLLSTQIKSPKRLRADFAPTQVNSDLFPRLEYHAPIGFFLHAQATLFDEMDDRDTSAPDHFIEAFEHSASMSPDDARRLMWFYRPFNSPILDTALLRLSRAVLGPDAKETGALFSLLVKKKRSAGLYAFDVFEAPVDATLPDLRARLDVGIELAQETYRNFAPSRFDALETLVTRIEDAAGEGSHERLKLLYAACRHGEHEICARQAVLLRERVAAADAPPDWGREIAPAEIMDALIAFDLPRARALVAEMHASGHPNAGAVENAVRRLADTERFFANAGAR
ncbi:fused MFS/spermidine synthase [bacterium]|nr:fused MFS/spermidine synthase [bacterium]